jgi:hypothetical protein
MAAPNGPKREECKTIIGKRSNDIFSFSESWTRGNDVRRFLLFYGHSVCEAKIKPAPKSIAMKLVTKVSPLTAKDTIMVPRVSTAALMCFGSIMNLHLPQCAEAKDMPSIREIVIS